MAEGSGGGFSSRIGGNAAHKPQDAYQSRGAKIMQLADMIRPSLSECLKGKHDENGMPVSPERMRGIALNMAQYLVKTMDAEAA